MGYTKAAHHKGTHQARSARIRAEANANPHHRCWRCHRTLDEVRSQERKPNAQWTAGHLPGWDGIPNAPMAAECSVCNYSHGARMGNARRRTTRRTALTW